MGIDPQDGQGAIEVSAIPSNETLRKRITTASDEKHPDVEVASAGLDSDIDDPAKIYVPEDDEEFIDPRLKNYPVPLVAKTVDLHNDFK